MKALKAVGEIAAFLFLVVCSYFMTVVVFTF